MVEYLDYGTYKEAYDSMDFEIDYKARTLRKRFSIGRFRFLLIDSPRQKVARVFVDDDRYGDLLSARFEWGARAENEFDDHAYCIMRSKLHWIGYD